MHLYYCNIYVLESVFFAAIQMMYFAFACCVSILWHITWKRKDKQYDNVEQLRHLMAYICIYLSRCKKLSIASDLNVLCWFDRGRHHGHLSWHWEPQWEALYPHICGPFAETGLPLCCAQSPRGLAEHWAYLPSHVHLWYEMFIGYDERMCLFRKLHISYFCSSTF